MDKSYMKWMFWLSFIIIFILNKNEAYATHAQSTDITYKCIGGNQYEISVSFYRDCAGVNAPNSATINVSSASCNQNFNVTLNKIAGTGQEVSPICSSFNTQCSGGIYPGVQEYIYRDIVTLPANCSDWVFSFQQCCRNAAINTIDTPLNDSIYVDAHLDNLNFSCNNSPVFSNRPIPFVCIGQQYCFNHGATDADGDSLSYKLVTPAKGANTTVTYFNPYSASQPLSSNPAVTFDNATGDVCMNPDQLQVTVMAVLVEEWRNGVLVGSVVRDMQLRMINCTNNIPYIDGINGTNTYTMNACAGVPVSFDINSYDADTSQNLTLTWNNGISGATFTTSGSNRPIGTFTWVPTINNANGAPYCFTVTVTDDNCPYNGSQTYSFCITVTGVIVNAGTDQTVCADNPVVTLSGNVLPYGTAIWSGGEGTFSPDTTSLNATYTPSPAEIASGSATLILTSQNNGSCAPSIDTVQINIVNFTGTINTNTGNVSCYGGNDGQATVAVTGGNPPFYYSWTTVPAQTTAIATGLTAGAYTATVTDSTGCTLTKSVTITQPVALSISSSSNDVSCNGGNDGSATAIASGGTAPYSFSWNTNPVQNTATATGLTAGAYTVTVTDSQGCNTTTSINIAQPSQIQLSTNSTVANCNASNGTANVVVTGGVSGYSYQWLPKGGNSASATGLSAGSYTVNVTDANGCPAIATTIVGSGPPPGNIAMSSTNVLCYGENNGSATVNVNGGKQPYAYQWSNGDTLPTISNLTIGKYSVTVTTANGCVTSDSITITQPTLLTASVSTVTNVSCNGGNNGNATVITLGGTAPYNYSWNTNPVQNTQTATNLPAGTYIVTVTDAMGCVATASVTVTQPLSLVISNSSSINVSCNGRNDGSANVSASGGIAPYTFSWNTNPVQNSATAIGLTAGIYTVTATDLQGCSTIKSITISQPLPLGINRNSTNVSCNGRNDGGATVIASGGTVPYLYSWNTVPAQNTPTAINLPAGIYTAKVTDAKGCMADTTALITQPASIVTNAQGTTTICLGKSALVAASATGGNGNYTYTWNPGQLTGDSIIVTPLTATTYTVTAMDSLGCKGTTSTVKVDVTSLSASDLTVSGTTTICDGENTVISAKLTGNTGTVSISWSNGLGNGLGPYIVSPSSPTTYTITVRDNCGNTVTDAVKINVNPVPTVNLAPKLGEACDQIDFDFENTSTSNSGYSYLWYFGDGKISALAKPSHRYTQSGVYNVTVHITTPQGCTGTASTSYIVNVYPSPKSDFTADPLVASVFEPTIKFTDRSEGATFWHWNFGDGKHSIEQNPTHTYAGKGNYTVTLTTFNQYGCMDSLRKTVEIHPEFTFYIPSAFTPNGDGKNDVFTGEGIEIREYEMMIFDRWGELIYTTNDLNKGWDGKVNSSGEIVQDGVYVYKVRLKDYKGRRHDYVGHVSLFK